MRPRLICLVVGFAAGCGTKGDEQKRQQPEVTDPEPGSAPRDRAPAPSTTSDWSSGAISFKAAWSTEGEATKRSKPARLTGTFYVGPDAVRLDIDVHPNSGDPASFIREHGEDDLWQIDLAEKRYDRALSGDWEHDIVPRVIEADHVDDIAKGECPFGRAKADECKPIGKEQVAGRPVQRWEYKGRELWVDPALRTVLKHSYTPFRKNPGAQFVELADVIVGEQDAAHFRVPAGFTCNAGSFCDSAPR